MRSILRHQSINAHRRTEEGSFRRHWLSQADAFRTTRGAALLVAGVITFCLVSTSEQHAAAASPSVDLVDSSDPVCMWGDDLIDEIDDIIDDLDTASGMVLSGQLPMDAETATSLKTLLRGVEASIDRVLDPRLEPSLWPADAGTADETVTAQALTEYADICCELAHAAMSAMQEATVDPELVGSRLKTLHALLPGYRAAAGPG